MLLCFFTTLHVPLLDDGKSNAGVDKRERGGFYTPGDTSKLPIARSLDDGSTTWTLGNCGWIGNTMFFRNLAVLDSTGNLSMDRGNQRIHSKPLGTFASPLDGGVIEHVQIRCHEIGIITPLGFGNASKSKHPHTPHLAIPENATPSTSKQSGHAVLFAPRWFIGCFGANPFLGIATRLSKNPDPRRCSVPLY